MEEYLTEAKDSFLIATMQSQCRNRCVWDGSEWRANVDSVPILPNPCAAPAGGVEQHAHLLREPEASPWDTKVPARIAVQHPQQAD